MHFGHLRQENENEQINKLLTDTWKVFQKKLSDAADFVVQEMLIIKQRLREMFEVTYQQKLCFLYFQYFSLEYFK
jgi:hypothetical protein